jgi:tellurium resistance protein TerD
MGVNLSKGAKVDLTKNNPVKKFRIGLGWNPNTATGAKFDADVSAFILDADGKAMGEKGMIFYGNLESENGFIKHTGDNQTGEGAGDDEKIIVDFAKVIAGAKRVAFVVTIHEAALRGQNFGQISGAYIRVMDEEKCVVADAIADEAARLAAYKAAEVLNYDLNEDYSAETAVNIGSIYERDGEWKFEAQGAGKQGGLEAFVTEFGLQLA